MDKSLSCTYLSMSCQHLSARWWFICWIVLSVLWTMYPYDIFRKITQLSFMRCWTLRKLNKKVTDSLHQKRTYTSFCKNHIADFATLNLVVKCILVTLKHFQKGDTQMVEKRDFHYDFEIPRLNKLISRVRKERIFFDSTYFINLIICNQISPIFFNSPFPLWS